MWAEEFAVYKEESRIRILVVNRALAEQMYVVSGDRLVFTDQALLEDEDGIRLETVRAENRLCCYPAAGLAKETAGRGDTAEKTKEAGKENGTAKTGEAGKEETKEGFRNLSEVLGEYLYRVNRWQPAGGEEAVRIGQVSRGRYTLRFPENLMEGVKDMRLQLTYSGDIGHAFLNGRLINDNFANGAVWEIGLKEFAEELAQDEGQMVIYITPLREGANVNVESAMAGRREDVTKAKAKLHQAELCPVYEIAID